MFSSRAALALALVLLAGPALANDCTAPATATHTSDLVIYDPNTGIVQEIVCPTNDAELTDPAYHPKGSTSVTLSHTPWTVQQTGGILAAASVIAGAPVHLTPAAPVMNGGPGVAGPSVMPSAAQ